MRVIKSPIGSFTAMRASSPARLEEARDQPAGTELAQRDPAELELAVVGTRPSRHFAAVADSGRRRVARQLSELERRGKALFHRLCLVADDRFQPRAPSV